MARALIQPAAIVALVALLSAPAGGAAESAAPIAEEFEEKPVSGESLCGPGTHIAEIEIVRLDVFDTSDPEFNRKVYRVINTVHRPMKTRVSTIRSLLTLELGQPCDAESLEEAERVLRGLTFVQDAWVEPVRREGDEVVLRVTLQDAWSTRIGASFSNEGGQTETELRIRESNLFGSGTQFTWTTQSGEDRSEKIFRWVDPALGSSRWRLDLLSADNSDGEEKRLRFGRPFYRFDARWAVSGDARRLLRDERVYVGRSEVDRWTQDTRAFRAAYGFAPGGRRENRLLRFEVGARSDQTRWTPASPSEPIDRPELRPLDRDLVLLGVHGSWSSLDFRRVQYLETAKRVEDIDLSQTLDFGVERSVGSLSEQSGSTWTLGYRRGFEAAPGTLIFLGARSGIERVGARWINGETEFDARLFHKTSTFRTLVFGVHARHGEALEGHRRYLLGGDTGVRGWPTRSFSGNRRVLLVAEHRYFAPWELFGWLRLGLVGFADVGAAWDSSGDFSTATVGGDLGIGLRGFLRPSSGDTTVHVDLSYAVGGALPDEERRLQLTVRTASTF